MAKNSTHAGPPVGASVDELRADAQATRAELGRTAAALADKTDVKKRVGQAAQRTGQQALDKTASAAKQIQGQAQDKAARVRGSVRAHPAGWSGGAAGLLTMAGALIGLLAWRRARRSRVGRAKRAWRAATNRFR